jgi:hypothetical protein
MPEYEDVPGSREWPEDSRPIVEPVEEYTGTAGRPDDRTEAGSGYLVEDDRRVPKTPFVVGAVLLLVIVVVVIVMLVVVL